MVTARAATACADGLMTAAGFDEVAAGCCTGLATGSNVKNISDMAEEEPRSALVDGLAAGGGEESDDNMMVVVGVVDFFISLLIGFLLKGEGFAIIGDLKTSSASFLLLVIGDVFNPTTLKPLVAGGVGEPPKLLERCCTLAADVVDDVADDLVFPTDVTTLGGYLDTTGTACPNF